MKQKLQLYNKSISFLFVLLIFQMKSFSQTNVFYYLTWGGDEWRAIVIKSFNQGDPTPQVRLSHSKVTPNGLEQTHYEDYIDYRSDAGEKWRATIHYNPNIGSFYFTHRKGGTGQSHNDVIMNYRNLSGEKRQLTIENCTLQQFQSNIDVIKVNSKITGRWDTGNPVDRHDSNRCVGNGVVNFYNTYSQKLWFYYWYAEDVANGLDECQIRKPWPQFGSGNNQFIIPKNKTLVYRIYTSSECLNNYIKQYGSAFSCQYNNGIINVN